MSISRKTIIAFSLVVLSVALAAGFAMAKTDGDPCDLWMQGKSAGSYESCLRALESKDLSFLSGHPIPSGEDKMDDGSLLKLCGRIKALDGRAIAVGLRLAVIFGEGPNEDVVAALSEAMAKSPKEFLVQLQDVIDFCRNANEVGALKESYWNAFIENDFGYGDQTREELKGVRKRKETIHKAKDSRTHEAQVYILKVLDEKIRRLTNEM